MQQTNLVNVSKMQTQCQGVVEHAVNNSCATGCTAFCVNLSFYADRSTILCDCRCRCTCTRRDRDLDDAPDRYQTLDDKCIDGLFCNRYDHQSDVLIDQ